MAKKEVQIVNEEVKVTKEINELGLAFKKIVEVGIKALEDGFQAGQDIPTVMLGSFKELSDALAGVDEMDEEAKEESVKAVMGALIPISEAIEMLLNRKKPVTAKANEVAVKK